MNTFPPHPDPREGWAKPTPAQLAAYLAAGDWEANRTLHRIVRLLREVRDLTDRWTTRHVNYGKCRCLYCADNPHAANVWYDLMGVLWAATNAVASLDGDLDELPEEYAARVAARTAARQDAGSADAATVVEGGKS